MLVSAPTDTTSHAFFTFVETLFRRYSLAMNVFSTRRVARIRKESLLRPIGNPSHCQPSDPSQITVVMGTSGVWTLFGAAA